MIRTMMILIVRNQIKINVICTFLYFLSISLNDLMLRISFFLPFYFVNFLIKFILE